MQIEYIIDCLYSPKFLFLGENVIGFPPEIDKLRKNFQVLKGTCGIYFIRLNVNNADIVALDHQINLGGVRWKTKKERALYVTRQDITSKLPLSEYSKVFQWHNILESNNNAGHLKQIPFFKGKIQTLTELRALLPKENSHVNTQLDSAVQLG